MSKKGYISDHAGNTTRNIKTELHKVTKKLEKLLERPVNKGGISEGGKRHKGLNNYITNLKKQAGGSNTPQSI